MQQNIQQADFDAVLKKPSLNKIEAKRFLAKYSTPYPDDFFEVFEPIGWGNDKKHQHKLFIISLNNLCS